MEAPLYNLYHGYPVTRTVNETEFFSAQQLVLTEIGLYTQENSNENENKKITGLIALHATKKQQCIVEDNEVVRYACVEFTILWKRPADEETCSSFHFVFLR